jgi:hypothetical protein
MLKYKILILLFFLVGCGYKPISHYAKEEIKGKVFIDSTIDILNSENSIMIKDYINNMVINKFDGQLVVKKEFADTIIFIKLLNIKYKGLSTDNDGYIQIYRVKVSFTIKYKRVDRDKSYKTIKILNYYDYRVDKISSITEENRKKAVKVAISKSLSTLFSEIAINSSRRQK